MHKFSGTYDGIEAFMGLLSQISSHFENFTVKCTHQIAEGNEVFSQVHGTTDGMDANFGDYHKIEDGKIKEFRIYDDSQKPRRNEGRSLIILFILPRGICATHRYGGVSNIDDMSANNRFSSAFGTPCGLLNLVNGYVCSNDFDQVFFGEQIPISAKASEKSMVINYY